MVSAVLAHGGAAGALIELAVILAILALFAAIAWLVGRRALAGQRPAPTRPPGDGDGPSPPLA